MSHRESDRRLGELALYIAAKSEDDQSFGKTKLNKILFYADLIAFGRLGESVTGTPYIKMPHGPFAARLDRVFKRLRKDYSAAEQLVPRYGKTQKRPVALRPADLRPFSGEQIAIVDEAIDRLADHDAKGVSLLSHRLLGWQLARENEEIPLATAFFEPRPLTHGEIRYGLELADDLGV